MDGGTCAPECENSVPHCVGMTAPVLGSVLIGKQGPIKRGCAHARAAHWLAEVTRPSWIKVTATRCSVGLVNVARCQPALQQKCAQQHLLVWWAVVCVTHTQKHILKIHGDMELVWYRLRLRCLQKFSLDVTGRWNDTEKICMVRVGNDKYNPSNVTQTRCRCRTSLK